MIIYHIYYVVKSTKYLRTFHGTKKTQVFVSASEKNLTQVVAIHEEALELEAHKDHLVFGNQVLALRSLGGP